jgi:hypothetical protein
MSRSILIFFLIAGLVTGGVCGSQAQSQSEIQQLKREMLELRRAVEEKQKKLDELERKALSQERLEEIKGKGTEGAEQPAEQAKEKTASESGAVGEEQREQKRALTKTAPVERGGGLIPAWRFVIEPSFEYDNFSSQNVTLSGFTIFEAILIGRVGVEKIKRDIFIPALTFRLGLKNSEINLRIPYLFRTDKIIAPRSGGATSALVEKNFSDSGLGDIEAYYYYHAIREGRWRPWVPDVILRAGVKFPTGKDPYHLNRRFDDDFGTQVATEFPTGTGHYGITFGGTFIKSIDPTVVFLNLAYYYNFPRYVGTVGGISYGDIKLGNSFEYSLGMVIALQERLSINFQYNQRIVGRTTSNGTPLTDTSLNAISFKFGATYVFSPRLTVDFVVGIGLNDDAPRASFLVRFPISPLFLTRQANL